jgi:hypothetical protein
MKGLTAKDILDYWAVKINIGFKAISPVKKWFWASVGLTMLFLLVGLVIYCSCLCYLFLGILTFLFWARTLAVALETKST